MGGVFTLIMHPQPNQSANNRMLDVYDKALNLLADDDNVWKSLQGEIADWIKRDRGEAPCVLSND